MKLLAKKELECFSSDEKHSKPRAKPVARFSGAKTV
jgi:hypothetical protein